MKKKSRKMKPKKEEIAEDWCFVCKDGGQMRVCDFKGCLKPYHHYCVGKDESFLVSGSTWKCGWHSCYECNRASTFKCYCCPKSVCERCINIAEFVHVKGKKGFCKHCLKLALLVEEKKDVDSDGEAVDFSSRETLEGLFKEYWEIVNEKEGLTVEVLISAKTRYRTSKNYNSDSDGSDSDEKSGLVSDSDDDLDNEEAHKPGKRRKRSKEKLSSGKGKVKERKTEFIGWGSKSLVQFLQSIGTDTSKELSQREVANIVTVYVKEHNLLDSQKKKTVMCDEKLQLFLKRKTVNKYRIYDLLEPHFAENQENSEEDEIGYSSDDMDDNVSVDCKRQKKSPADRKPTPRVEPVLDAPRYYFAAIVPENIRLVYLKKSLVEILSKDHETFESKVTGSFVRFKVDPNECFRKNFYQLGQVTGIIKHAVGGNEEILLRIADTFKDISITVLSDNDFSDEECLDLKNKVKSGLLRKLTLDGLEQKARSLHKDITEFRIPREIESLERRAEHANLKGWRQQLFELMKEKQKLQNPEEKARLLQQVPKVIADEEDLGSINEDITDAKQRDEESPKSILMASSVIRGTNLKGNSSSDVAVENGRLPVTNNVSGSVKDCQKNEEAKNVDTVKIVIQDNKNDHCKNKSFSQDVAPVVSETTPQEEKLPTQTCLKACITEAQPKNSVFLDSNDQCYLNTACIDLSSDDEGDGKSHAAIENETKPEDPKKAIWHCVGPNGEKKGPLSLNLMKCWSEGTPFASKFKVWKENQNEAAAIPLMDAISYNSG